MIQATQKDDQLLEAIRSAASADDEIALWWLGQSGFLIKHAQTHVLMDPYLSDSLTRKYAATDKPHVRMTEIPIAAERLDMLQCVTSSHNHTDHLDGETLRDLLRVNAHATMLVPAANLTFAAERLDVSEKRLAVINDGETVQFGDVRISAVPAAHEEVERDELGRCRYLGYVLQIGRFTIYHSGDTIEYQGQVEALRRWKIDVAILPINGAKPERRVAGNLNGPQAARLAHAIGAKCVIPCHYDMFEFNTEKSDAFVRECSHLGQEYRVLSCGETWIYKERMHAD